jgi:hypothetical protein
MKHSYPWYMHLLCADCNAFVMCEAEYYFIIELHVDRYCPETEGKFWKEMYEWIQCNCDKCSPAIR